MARVLGVGGVFFKTDDRKKLAAWYEKWLSLPLSENFSGTFKPNMMPEPGESIRSYWRCAPSAATVPCPYGQTRGIHQLLHRSIFEQ